MKKQTTKKAISEKRKAASVPYVYFVKGRSLITAGIGKKSIALSWPQWQAIMMLLTGRSRKEFSRLPIRFS